MIDVAITVFMVMFGINFALYYCAITGNWRGIVKSEELRWYLGIFLTVTAAITVVLLPQYGTGRQRIALRQLSGCQHHVHHGLCHSGF